MPDPIPGESLVDYIMRCNAWIMGRKVERMQHEMSYDEYLAWLKTQHGPREEQLDHRPDVPDVFLAAFTEE